MTLSLAWRIFYWGWFLSEVIVAIATRTKSSSGQVRDRGSLLLLWIVIFASLTAGISISEATSPTMFAGAQVLRLVSLIVLVVGLAIRWTAILSLGKFFSSNVAIRDSQQLYRSGLYRFVRHPSYLGLLLVLFAVALHTRNWLSFFIIILPTTAALLYRIHVEEAALLSAFGEEYAAYSKSTNRLLPGLY